MKQCFFDTLCYEIINFPFLVLASPSNWPFWGVPPRPLPTGYTITKARALGGGMRIQVNWLRSAFSIHLVPVLFNQSHVKRTRWHVPSKASSSDHVELVQSVSDRPSIKPGSKDTIRQHRHFIICLCIGGIDKYCFSVIQFNQYIYNILRRQCCLDTLAQTPPPTKWLWSQRSRQSITLMPAVEVDCQA